MNQFILVAMNRENYTQAELDANADESYAAATWAATEASEAAASDSTQDVEYWIGRYFEVTGEDRSEYEKEIKKEKQNG